MSEAPGGMALISRTIHFEEMDRAQGDLRSKARASIRSFGTNEVRRPARTGGNGINFAQWRKAGGWMAPSKYVIKKLFPFRNWL